LVESSNWNKDCIMCTGYSELLYLLPTVQMQLLPAYFLPYLSSVVAHGKEWETSLYTISEHVLHTEICKH
jgi:hypothetical protein